MHRIPSAIVFQQCVVTPRRWDCSMRCHMLDPLVVVLINASSLVLFPGISRSVSSRFCSLVSCLFQKFVDILVPLGGWFFEQGIVSHCSHGNWILSTCFSSCPPSWSSTSSLSTSSSSRSCKDGLLLYKGLSYVPESSLHTDVWQEHHDAPLAGHSPELELITRNYRFPVLHHLRYGELAPVFVTTSLWNGLRCHISVFASPSSFILASLFSLPHSYFDPLILSSVLEFPPQFISSGLLQWAINHIASSAVEICRLPLVLASSHFFVLCWVLCIYLASSS